MLIKEVDRNPIDLSNRVRGFEPVNEDAYYKLPTRSDKRSAGYDFYSTETFTIQPNEFHTFKTNIKAYMKDDEYLAIHVRSSIGIKKNLILKNVTGVIDSSYYDNPSNGGDIAIGLFNYGNEPQTIKKGDRVAQGIFAKYLTIDDDVVLNKSRSGGIGSSGI